MSWNYRLIKHKDGLVGLHEVFYDEQDNPKAYTKFAVFYGDDVEDVLREMRNALNDSENQAVLLAIDFEKKKP
jgi:hypothetical protein